MDTTSRTRLDEWASNGSDAYLINPTRNVLSDVVDAIEKSDSPGIRCLVSPQTLRAFDRQYSLASRMSKFERDGAVEFREMDGHVQANLLVSDETIRTCLDLGEFSVVTTIETGEEKVSDSQISAFIAELEQKWQNGADLSLQTPVGNDVRQAFSLTCQESVYDEFEAVVKKMEKEAQRNQEGDATEFTDRQHTYAAVVVAGAVEEVTQGDLGNATETCGLASRSTVYRFKRGLRDSGLIEVRQVDSGRGGRSKELAITSVYQNESLDTLVERAYSELDAMDDTV